MSVDYVERIAFFFVGAYTLTFLFTPVMIGISSLVGLEALPGGRHHHSRPTPTGIGVAPLMVMVIMTVVYLLLPGGAQDAATFTQHWGRIYLIGLFQVFLIGVVDDKWAISPWVKLVAEIGLAVFVYAHGINFGSEVLGVSISPWIDLCCTVAWLIVIMNAYNLIDGYDGLACGLAAISGLGLFGILVLRGQYHEAMMVSALVGSVLGFARYNWAPARAFLGDTGSLFIGFSFSFFSLSSSLKGASVISFWLPILCFGVPLFDTILAVWRRVAKKVVLHLEQSSMTTAVTSGDGEHLHHRLVSAGLTPRRMNSVLYLANSLLVLAAVVSISINNSTLLTSGMIGLLFGGVIVVKRIARIELRESGRVVVLACSSEANPILARVGYALIDSAALVVLFILSHSIARMNFGMDAFIQAPTDSLWLWLMLFIPSNILLDTFWVEWQKSLSIRRALARFLLHALVGIVCCVIERGFGEGSALELALQGFIFSSAFSVFCTFIRMLPSHIQAVLAGQQATEKTSQ